MSQERLQKILSRAGVSSRRKAEALISAGRVRVDGRIVTELGVRADPKVSRVELDGRRLVAEALVYLVLHNRVEWFRRSTIRKGGRASASSYAA